MKRRSARSKRRRRVRIRKSTSQKAPRAKTNLRASERKMLNRPGRKQSQIGANKRERSKRRLKKPGKRKRKRSGSLRRR